MPSAFQLRDVVAGAPDDPILQGVTVDVPCGGVTAIAGPSGAGKSSLLRLLNRLTDPIAGQVMWEEQPLGEMQPCDLRRRVGMVFQRPPVFVGTVFDNLRVADPAIDESAGREALERVGLDAELLHRTARDLSGGEAQRMCFARALLTGPEVLLADEPTSSLDGAARETIEALGRRLADDGMPTIWVSHDVAQLRRLADHVIVLVDGKVVATGTVNELDQHTDPQVRALVGTP
ncbi:MAG: ATP-binding cassette domain-containing protein [Ilumatobacter sp.]|nr:ATP-binding cassette domain-containing protein [Ilumatobacter sp.]